MVLLWATAISNALFSQAICLVHPHTNYKSEGADSVVKGTERTEKTIT